ncbi:S-adenosylmethionine decarboxylase proenzyme isoform X1 [Wyeomyia smithii]|uniref:S-adenosylmethionine decarboxylase proenzyme isoform X1 n=1 Tax=Wyeomyia smithii TaxID=174621 RepID=UPI002467CF19|nr:S-adenosylmethionine decarboxylase proenzyme isoform X1 [Wyeomyia smithii]XP_055539393.1 S-adenosylmethionine decarboxylase proenzyme isoform X1 [Wyeomyia smithii]
MAENEDLSSSNSSSSSSREDMHFFEGVEKLLEIWFESNSSDKNADLRKIPRSMWDALLKTVRCEIISFTRNEQIDAYVLSESSMFVSKRRWILKTCGTTTPLQCLEPLLRLASEIAGYTEIEDLFYSRKNFKRPELQVSPHRGFDEEVAFLDSFFEDGRAYSLGAINRDCWYLYTLSRGGGGSANKQFLNNMKNNNNNNNMNHCKSNMINNTIQATNVALTPLADLDLLESLQLPDPDQTIEILMTHLDPNVMAIFTKDMCNTAMEATQKSGIHKLIPGMVIDDYLFDPCGYSMNGVSKSCGKKYKQGCYMTIHITPEPDFSYVSFESNVASSSYGDLIARVIDTFQPGKFVVTVFANKTSPAANAFRELEHLGTIDQWKRRDIQFSRFASYDLTYAQYCKYPS